MKISQFAILIILFNAFAFSQSVENGSVLRLENDFKNSILLSELSQDQHIQLINQNKKNPALAILYSLLLPGMGELYAESYSTGKYFTIAEGVLWGVYIGMNTYGEWQKDRYKSYASSRGGVNINGKDEDYFAVIGEYISIDEYNDTKALEREFDAMYDSEKYFWKWQSNEERKSYRSMWVSSEQTFNDMRFVVGALILNRIASAINAVRLVSAYNNKLEDDLSWNVYFSLSNNQNLPTSMNVNFRTAF
jgi:hypothetical protein